MKTDYLNEIKETINKLGITCSTESMLFCEYEEKFYFDGYLMFVDMLDNLDNWKGLAHSYYSFAFYEDKNLVDDAVSKFVSKIEEVCENRPNCMLYIEKHYPYTNMLFQNYLRVEGSFLLYFVEREGQCFLSLLKNLLDYLCLKIYEDYTYYFIEEETE